MYTYLYEDKRTKEIYEFTENSIDVIKFKNYAYKPSKRGKFKSIYQEPLVKVHEWTSWEEKYNKVLYSDVKPITKYAIDKYNFDESVANPTILFYDIETIISTGEVTAISYKVANDDKYGLLLFDTDLYNKLNTNNANLEYCHFEMTFKNELADVYVFNKENLMLGFWLDKWNEINPHIYSGWNNDGFDNIHLYNRIRTVLGKSYADSLSPINKIEKRKKSFKGISDDLIFIIGRSSLDLMKLHKKFVPKVQPEYGLDYIAKVELGYGKVEYNGNLEELKMNDIQKFCEYALTDVQLLQHFENKKKYIKTAVQLCTLGRCNYEDIYYSSIYLDGAILSILKENKLVAPNQPSRINLKLLENAKLHDSTLHFSEPIPKRMPSVGMLKVYKTKSSKFELEYVSKYENTITLLNPLSKIIKTSENCEKNELYNIKVGFTGAYVKQPNAGRYEWIYGLDLTSLYPSIAMSLNISPETKVGRILVYDSEYNSVMYNYNMLHKENDFRYCIENTKHQFLTWSQFKEVLTENYAVAVNGVVYRQDFEGIIPKALLRWFNKRVEYKRLRKQAYLSNDKVLYDLYDFLQMVYKILLNSLYGVLGLDGWRFNDLDNSEAITATGRFGIKSTAKCANTYYYKEMNIDKSSNVDFVIYTDTDSIFCEAFPLIKHYYGDKNIEFTDDFLIDKSNEIATDVQNYINSFYDYMSAEILNIKKRKHYFDIKKEYVAKSVVWLSKKQYAQWLVSEEGKRINKLDVKGLAMKKSNFPPYFKKCMTEIIWDVLYDKSSSEITKKLRDMYSNLKDVSITDISKNSSVSEISMYDKPFVNINHFDDKLSGHVRAALIYNRIIKKFDYTNTNIGDGSKIKWVYLNENPLNIESIAFKGFEDPPKILEFIDKYIDRQKLWENEFETKITSVYEAMDWQFPNLNVVSVNDNYSL